jgi:cell division protein FtsI (penicillin-binding protein 3)
VKKAFAVSTNVGIYNIIKRSYEKNPQAFIDRLRSMHIADSVPLQIHGGTKPRLKNTFSEDWSKNSLAYLSIGYESLFTPLQLLTFYNAVANNGKMVKPLFVKEIRNMGEVVKTFPTEVIADSICSSKTIAKARELLEEVVKSGTASHIKHAQYSIAGKTGTAQIAQGSGGYGYQKKYQASFCGYFPADKPRYSCAVVVYSPGNNVYYAASVACPVFKDIADKVYALDTEMHKELSAPPDSVKIAGPSIKAGRSVTVARTFKQMGVPVKLASQGWVSSDLREFTPQSGKVPDVTGMGLRDAVFMLERQGLQVKPSGRGAVLRQSIKPGSPVEKGSLITIELG